MRKYKIHDSVGEVELIYTKKESVLNNLDKIKRSSHLDLLFRQIFDIRKIKHSEKVYALYIDNSNKILGYAMISSGGLTASIVDVRIIFQNALLLNATRIILAHNHPSGSLNPSDEDKDLTRRIKEAGKILNISLLDHIIITEYSYYSFADNGLII